MKHPILLRMGLYGWRTGLLLGAVTAAFVIALGSPDGIKSALSASGVYPLAADRIAGIVSNRTLSSLNPSGVGADSTVVRQAASETFTPQAIQQSSERVVDNTYAWLQGKSDRLDLSIDTSSYTDTFTNKLTGGLIGWAIDDTVKDSAASPACTPAQLQQLGEQFNAAGGNLENLNFDTLGCSPLAGATQEARDGISTLFEQAADSGSSLASPIRDQAERSISQELQSGPVEENLQARDYLPTAYQLAMLSPWLFAGLAILSALLVWAAADEWQYKIRRLARSALGVGIVVVIIAALTRLAAALLAGPTAGFVGNGFDDVLARFISLLGRQFDVPLCMFGATYIAAAVLSLVYLRRIAPRGTHSPTEVVSTQNRTTI